MNKVISENEVKNVVADFNGGVFVSIVFDKKNGERRMATAQFGVVNPTNAPAPNGRGESGREAITKGRLKFFDASVVNADGSYGNYRQTKIENIVSITGNGVTYIIDHSKGVIA